MLSAVLRGPGEVALEETDVPQLTGPGQVLVRNVVSTICGSDLHNVLHGTHPADAEPGFPGHESVGVVLASSAEEHEPGDLVLAVPDLAHAGGFAPTQLLPARFLLPLPATADPRVVVLAQQLGTAVFAMKRFWPTALPVPPGATALVLGAGPAGLFFTRLCRLAGFDEVVCSDLHPHRLAAAVRMGATRTVDARSEDVSTGLATCAPGGAALVVEAAGADASRRQAFECVALDGRVGLFGLPQGADIAVPFEHLFRRRPTIEICWGAQAEPGLSSFRTGLDLVVSGRVDTAPLALRLWPFEELPEALRHAAGGLDGVVKAGVLFR